ncbi:hypothetical protein JTE90_015390, partial [Oedothorax gibbosus]
MEPLSTFSPQGSLEYCYYSPRSAPVAAPGGLTPGTFKPHATATLLLMRRKTSRGGNSAVAARYRPNAGASPFSGVVSSVGGVTHPLRIDFHFGPSSGLSRANPKPFMGLMSVSHRRLKNRRLVYPKRQSAFPKVAHWGLSSVSSGLSHARRTS